MFEGCLPLNLKKMSLFRCSKVVASLKGPWGTNPCIEYLCTKEEDVECFPGEGLLLLSLITLYIYDFPKLKRNWITGVCVTSPLLRHWLFIIVQYFNACQRRVCLNPFQYLILHSVRCLNNGARKKRAKTGKRLH